MTDPIGQRTVAGRRVGPIGLGCMPMSWLYDRGGSDATSNGGDAKATIRSAIDAGVTLFDTADVYGPFANEALLGKALERRRDEAFIATKVGLIADGAGTYHRNGSRAHIIGSCDASLQRLRTDRIDLYQLHRVDPATPLEESMQTMRDLVEAGKVRAIGLSEVDVDELDRAAALVPIAAVQSEFSLWTRDPQRNGVLAWCERAGAALLAYAPLGRGYLTGTIRSIDDLPADDWRRNNPRFLPEAIAENQTLVDEVHAVAQRCSATPAQVALRWLLERSSCVLPIPGTRRAQRVRENADAGRTIIGADDLAALTRLAEPSQPRY